MTQSARLTAALVLRERQYFGLMIVERKREDEAASFTKMTDDAQRVAEGFRETVGDREPQADAAFIRLKRRGCAKERRENVSQVGFGNPRPPVAHFQSNGFFLAT